MVEILELKNTEPDQALRQTIIAVTDRVPGSTLRASAYRS